MNNQVKKFWYEFWEGNPPVEEVEAWNFGFEADVLADLVMHGIKRATTPGYIFYELENEPLPTVGQYDVILNSHEEPVCIVKTTDIQIMPFNEVPESYARIEGEGDLSYEYWKTGHEAFFKKECLEYGIEYEEKMLVVCWFFELAKK